MTGTVTSTPFAGRFGLPADPDDFRRCHILLCLFPEWRRNLSKVSAVFPDWQPMVERWAEMERLFVEEWHTGSAPKLYALMSELRKEGWRQDEWIEKHPGYWEKVR